MKKLRLFLKQKVIPKTVAYLGKPILALLAKTCRYEIQGLERYKEVARKEKCMIMVWHNRLVLIPKIICSNAKEFQYAALVSKSRDGEILSTLTNSYSIGSTIRVAHDARKNALDGAINYLSNNKGILIVTPDGPKGPVHRMKKGSVYLAKGSGATIIPLNWSTSHAWHINSWDRMAIPKPFSTIKVVFGEPIRLQESKKLPSKEEVVQVEEALNSLRNNIYSELS